MRFALPVLALAAALLLVGAIQLTRADSTAAAQHILTFQEVGGSGIAGTATLTAVGNDVEVVVEVTGLTEGTSYVSGAYDNTSVTCVGGLISDGFSPFTYGDGGVTYTVAGKTVSDVFSVSVRSEDASTVLACAQRAAPPAEEPAEEVHFQAVLTGDAEVPPVTTDAGGTFTATLNADRTALSFELVVSNIVGVTQAHPHCGQAGETKPIFAFLYGAGMTPGDVLPTPPPAGLADPIDVDGVLSTGTLTADNLIGETPCAASFDAMVDALLNGGVYINVHTEGNPPGVVRGQIEVVEAAPPPAEVPAPAATPAPAPAAVPVTGGPPPAGDSGFAWWYVLMATGALALLGGGALTLRLRQQR